MRKLTKIEEVNKKALGKNSALFHVTKTILNKSIQDCNSDLRTLLKAHNILDYDELGEGSKVTLRGKFADGSETNISCYRAKTRGDKRIWFSGIKDHARIDDIMAMIIKGGKIIIKNVTTGAIVAVVFINQMAGVI